MSLLSWSKQYLIGDDIIDAEHIKLFELINDFHSRWMETQDKHEISEVFRQLVAYAEIHFQHEESIMAEAGYPKLTEHQKIHETMFETIFELHKSHMEKGLRLEMDTMRFVRSWLLDHILQEDYLFRDFLKRTKKEAEVPPSQSADPATSKAPEQRNYPDISTSGSPDTPNQIQNN